MPIAVTKRKPFFMATMIWSSSPKPKHRVVPWPRLTKPEMMAAT